MTEQKSKKSAKITAKTVADKKKKSENKSSSSDIENIITALLGAMDGYSNIAESIHRPADRIRKFGPGIRRYGFIDKTSDLALANQTLAPALFNAAELKKLVRDIEITRTLLNYLQQYARLAQDSLLVIGDRAYSMALLYYQSVRELSRRNVPGAETVFRSLEPYFRQRTTESQDEQPTEAKVERDVRALLHGRKEGKIVIENEKSHLVKGKHVVIDETHKDRFNEEVKIDN